MLFLLPCSAGLHDVLCQGVEVVATAVGLQLKYSAAQNAGELFERRRENGVLQVAGPAFQMPQDGERQTGVPAPGCNLFPFYSCAGAGQFARQRIVGNN